MYVSTERLYGMSQNSADHSKHRSRQQKARLAPILSSTVTSAETQCEVAFPGNRIFSPTTSDDVQLQQQPDHLVDVHKANVSDVVNCKDEMTSEDVFSWDNHASAQPLIGLCTDDTGIAGSDGSNSLTVKHPELSRFVEQNESVKTADSRGASIEDSGTIDVPLEPMKAEKLATFGNCVTVAIQ